MKFTAKKMSKFLDESINLSNSNIEKIMETSSVEVIYSSDQIAFIFDSRSECDKGEKVLKSAGEFTGGYYSRIHNKQGVLIEPSLSQFLASHLPYYVGKLKNAGFNVGIPSKANGKLF
jgi:hypothetical protein